MVFEIISSQLDQTPPMGGEGGWFENLTNRQKAIIYYNIYLFLTQCYNVSTKFLMRPGGLHGRDPDHYNGVDPLEMSFLRILFNACSSFCILTFKFNKKITDFPRH